MAEKPAPPRRAAALRCERGEDQAPRLVAKGRGLVADQILAVARQHSIPIHQDPALVDVLSRLGTWTRTFLTSSTWSSPRSWHSSTGPMTRRRARKRPGERPGLR
jgi:type III secretion system FlhB-like substrate exporter